MQISRIERLLFPRDIGAIILDQSMPYLWKITARRLSVIEE